jgi:hypothetical protein
MNGVARYLRGKEVELNWQNIKWKIKTKFDANEVSNADIEKRT